MAPVDVETLPPSRAYSLGGFVARAEALLNISANAFKVYGKLGKRVEQKKSLDTTGAIHSQFYKFVISGEDAIDDQKVTVRMDTHYDCVTEDAALSVKSYADIDSVLGRSDSIPFKAQASLYPLANFKYTLTKPVHLEYRLLKGDKELFVEVAHMPNAAYMKIGDRYTGRLVFPTLYEQGMSKDATARQVPLQILEDVFQIFTSTLIELQETEQAHLTVNYGAESSRQSRMGGGPPGQGTHAIAPDILEPLTRQVLVKIRQQQWGKDAFWFHEFRGMRAANVSRLEDLPQRPEDIFDRISKD